MRISFKVLYCFIFVVFHNFSYCQAGITGFPFITSFDCENVVQNDSPSECGGLEWGGHWYFDTYRSMITSEANNLAGVGKGFRTIDGDGTNVDTGPLSVNFPSPQKELWIRWYQRHEVGYKWNTTSKGTVPQYDKHVYLFTGTQHTAAIAEYWYDQYVIVAQNVPVPYPVRTKDGDGWTGIMRGNESDGLFHCFEVHVKMDTNGGNGIGQIWIDGVLKASNLAVDWSGGDAVARNGWTNFKLGENQHSPSNGKVMYVDHDDLAVYNTTPPKMDVHGNAFIGPLALPPQEFKK